MLSLPNPPTDSLYKFLFVFGIAMIISGKYLGIIETEKYKITVAKIDSLSDVSNKKLANLGFAVANNPHYKLDTLDSRLFLSPKELKMISLKLNEALSEYNGNLYQIRCLIWVGIFMAILGGFLWYFKIQRYQRKDLVFKSNVNG